MAGNPVVIRGSTRKAVLRLGASAALAVVCVLGVRDPDQTILIWMGYVACVMLALWSVIAILVPPRLTLDDEGLTWRGLRRWHLDWSHIARFRLISLRLSSSVVIDYRDGHPANARAWSRAWARLSRPRTVPTILWMEPRELHDVLQDRLRERQVLLGPAEPEPPPEERTGSIALPVTVVPWFSIGLIAVLVAVFAAEMRFPVTPAPARLQASLATLVGFGGLNRLLLFSDAGQWFRLVTASFVHSSLLHLVGNVAALFLAGRLLEGVVGRVWFGAIYAVGVLGGAAGSLLLNPGSVVGVGASGAILALFAAACVCSVHFARSAGRYRLQSGAMAVLVPTLLGTGGTGVIRIDVGNHLGGAIAGVLMGLLLLKGWTRQAPHPPRQRVGLALAGLGALAAVAALWPAAMQHGRLSAVASLVPDTLMPKSDADLEARAPGLIGIFPADPRLHFAIALKRLREGDPVAAEGEARQSLRLLAPVQGLLSRSSRFEAGLWSVLGQALAARDVDGEARAAYDKAGALDPALPGLTEDRAHLDLQAGHLDQALAEATGATREATASDQTWSLIGDIQFARADLKDAFAAYDRAESLAPSASNERARGLVRFYVGDEAGAIADLQHAIKSEPHYAYGTLWLAMVLLREGISLDDLSGDLVGTKTDWPAPVMRLFLEGTNPPAVLAAAEDSAPDGREGRRCEAGFYIAEWDLLHGEQADAAQRFHAAAQSCPPAFVETWMARTELAIDAQRRSAALRP